MRLPFHGDDSFGKGGHCHGSTPAPAAAECISCLRSSGSALLTWLCMAALRYVHAGELLCCQSTGLLLRQREQQLEPEGIRAIEIVPAAEGAAPLKQLQLLDLAASRILLQHKACVEGDGPSQSTVVTPNLWCRLTSGLIASMQQKASAGASLASSLILWRPSASSY